MAKQYVGAPIITNDEPDLAVRQKVRRAFSDYASAISLLQDDIYKAIDLVKNSIVSPSSTLGGCVILDPATATRNVIQPTAVLATNLVLKAVASQTAKLLELHSSAGAVVGSITTAGVIATMEWQGVTVGTIYGGTGLATYTTGDTLYASATNTLAKLTIGALDKTYGVNDAGTLPTWKPVLITDAGAMSGITTLSATGTIRTSAGNVVIPSGSSLGLFCFSTGADRAIIQVDSEVLYIGDLLNAPWKGMQFYISASGASEYNWNQNGAELMDLSWTNGLNIKGGFPVKVGELAGTGNRAVIASATGVLSAGSITPSTATTGDLLYASATNTWSNLALGTARQVLHVNAGGTQVEWGAVTGTGNVVYSADQTLTGTLTGAIANWSGDQNLTYSNSGAKVLQTIKNSSNTASSHAELFLSNGGSSGGNAYVRFLDNTVNWFFGAVLGGTFEFNRQGTSGGSQIFSVDGSRNLLFAPANGSGSLLQFAYSLNSAPTTEYPFIAATNNGGSAPFNSRGHLIIGGRNSSANQDIYVYTSVAGTLTKTFTFSGGNSTSNGTLTSTGVFTASSTSTFTGMITANGGITFGAGDNIVLATSTGSMLGSAANQLLGLWGATPVDQPAHIPDPAGGVVIDVEARAAIALINARDAEIGITAAS